MKLSLGQIKEITCGAVNVTEEDGGFLFYRFTKEQTEAYKTYRNEEYECAPKTLAPSSVRLAFATDSKHFSFRYGHNNKFSKGYAWIEVYVNGEKSHHFGLDEGKKDLLAEVSLGEGMKNIEVYFPWQKQVIISDVTIDDGASVTPLKRSKVMINYGDSITQGFGTQRSSLCYASRIARMLDADNYNRGIGSDCFFPELLDLDEPIKCPDYITVAYGVNDWTLNGREVIQKSSRDFLVKLRAKFPNAKIFVISPIWYAEYLKSEKFDGDLTEVHGILEKTTADIPGVVLINGWDFVPKDPVCFADGCHPNEFGMGHYADNLYAEMKKHL